MRRALLLAVCAAAGAVPSGRAVAEDLGAAQTPAAVAGDLGAAPAAAAVAPSAPWTFRFGSYGRVVAASDLQGGSGRQVNIAAHGPRIEERPYLELELATGYAVPEGPVFDTVLTLAVTDALFHLDGDFDGAVAIRNAYVRAAGFGLPGVSIWAGSRMLRGDDVYLLDLWPLDNLNTVGGGVRIDVRASETTVSAHGGVAQLRTPFQYQEIEVAAPTFGTESFLLLDRSRAIGSLRLEQRALDLTESLSAKVVAYGEVQAMGSGTFENEDDLRVALPAESGYAVGGQLGAWGFGEGAFVNLFFRYARGLAAYGELSQPATVSDDRTASGARSLRLALSGDMETRWAGVTVGGVTEWFQDADDARYDPDDYAEQVIVVRPAVFVTDHFHQAVEVSYQHRATEGLSARTDTYLEQAVWKVGVLPTLSLGRGMFSRPQLRVIYSASFLNEGARDRWPEGDRRSARTTQHFLGGGAEWWFNSSSYQ